MAARISQGDPWSDGKPCQKGSIIIIKGEDDKHRTLAPRLRKFGVDDSKVHIISKAADKATSSERIFSLLQDVPELHRLVQAMGDVRMIIIDPIQHFYGGALSGKVNPNSDPSIRAVLGPLHQLAEDTGIAVLGVTHLNKASQQEAMYRIGGSIGLMGLPRAVWLLKASDDPNGPRYLQNMKLSVERPAPGIVFRFHPDDGTILFSGEHCPSVNELFRMADGTEDSSMVAKAALWLRALLANGPMFQRDIAEEAALAGYSPTTLLRANRDAGVKHRRIGMAGRSAVYEWFIPDADRQDRQDAIIIHPENSTE